MSDKTIVVFRKFKDQGDIIALFPNEVNYVNVDWDNDALSFNLGGTFIINEGGDVYDSDTGKFFISNDDYRNQDSGDLNEGKRNELIEAYMEKTGCYPGVFSTDRYGNVFAVNTKA